MKKFCVSVLAMLFVFSMMEMVHAAPIYYSLSGIVTEIGDDAGIVADAGLSVGSEVNYTFLVDFYANGSYLINAGDTIIKNDEYLTHYFFVDYISGSALSEKDGGYYNAYSDVAENNYGRINTKYSQTNLVLNSDDNNLSFFSWNDQSLSDGSFFDSYNRAFDSEGNESWIRTELFLKEIPPPIAVPVVPEPTTMMLLSSIITGLAGFGFIRKKQ